ncbi:MAG: NAD(P)/FAD-dependent oxidoreductase [Verrucomicrobiales bacterium]
MNQPPPTLLVIGGGSAGYAAARTAVDLGFKTTVVDGSETLGGLCILRGCMPSKALIESANRYLTLRRAREFGLRAEGISVRPEEIRERKRALIAEFADYRRGQLENSPFELLRGRGRFIDSRTIEVAPRSGGALQKLKPDAIVIATGSETIVPPIPGLAEAGYLTSDDILESATVPESVTVLGGGAIAVEMAHYLEGVGARVTIIQRSPHLLKGLDHDVSGALRDALGARGIEIHCGTQLERVERGGQLTKVQFTQDGTTRSVESHALLVALGRSPATRTLQLERAEIETAGDRVIAGCDQATSRPHIFAAGDACGPHEIVHIAISQGEIAAHNAAVFTGLLPNARQRFSNDRLKILGIFTEPQVASVGLTEREAEEHSLAAVAASYPFDDHGKSMVRGETEGFVKLIADRATGEIVGGAAVGPEAVELIHEIVVAMHFRSSPGQLASIPHYHPTLSEIWTYPAEELAQSLGPGACRT